MKKVLFLIPSLRIGGTVSSLNSILNSLSIERYDFSVYSLSRSKQTDVTINTKKIVLSSFFADCLHSVVLKEISLKNFCVIVIKLFQRFFLFFKLSIIDNMILKREAKRLSLMNFDTVVAFEENSIILNLISCIKCQKRIIWIHCDYSRIANKCYNKAFDVVDKIICVSKYTRDIFTELLPQYSQKTDYIYNLMNVQIIKELANKPIVDEYEEQKYIIISVGRLDPIKQFSKIPYIVSLINKITKIDIHWYIIGDYDVPGEYELIVSEIKKYQLSSSITLMGKKQNPYPYMKSADLLVSTSASEACPYVINEAKIVGIPIICNNFGSVGEFIENGRSGFICSIDEMPKMIAEFIENSREASQIRQYLQSYSYPNSIIIEKLISTF